jgi:hypothetical protein
MADMSVTNKKWRVLYQKSFAIFEIVFLAQVQNLQLKNGGRCFIAFFAILHPVQNLQFNDKSHRTFTSNLSSPSDVMPFVSKPDIGSFWSTDVHKMQPSEVTDKHP